MARIRLSVFDALIDALPSRLVGARELPIPEFKDGKITLPFIGDVTTAWDWTDLDPANDNAEPNLNLTVMALILATNAETTRGGHAWTQTETSLCALGFTNMAHHYFEDEERINHPGMVFGKSTVKVSGKTVVAAVFRGSSSIEDAISDFKAEPGGFQDAGINATTELKAYLKAQGLSKEDTILFITGHSYGAATASLVTIMSAELAERDSIFGYSFATPNYIRHGLTGDGMKMFSFDSNEDVVPQVPVGPNLDKTGVCLKYDRLGIKLEDPARYERFLKIYSYFRGKNFDEDTEDVMPKEYSGYRGPVRHKVNSVIVRNHMPYTYMALILSALDDERAYSYISLPADDADGSVRLKVTMYAGEVYRLPFAGNADSPVRLTWASSDDSVVTVTEAGMLKAVAAGTTSLVATAADGKSATVAVTVMGA